ncbi:MAG: EamA family transporter, partial [Myxococcales bacterium]|nr:EamA family transporter [Myxococcales bacterium]
TVLTPLYVVAWDDLRGRRFHPRGLALAALAVVGAVILHPRGADPRAVAIGFGLVQAANACFAIGQIEYRRLRRARPELHDRRIHGYLLLGGLGLTTITTTLSGGWASAAAIDLRALAALAYLGLIASGIGFFAWNAGAVRVESATLAVLNNLKVPLGVALSLLLFGEEADLRRLALGGGLMIAAAVAAERRPRGPRAETA